MIVDNSVNNLVCSNLCVAVFKALRYAIWYAMASVYRSCCRSLNLCSNLPVLLCDSQINYSLAAHSKLQVQSNITPKQKKKKLKYFTGRERKLAFWKLPKPTSPPSLSHNEISKQIAVMPWIWFAFKPQALAGPNTPQEHRYRYTYVLI